MSPSSLTGGSIATGHVFRATPRERDATQVAQNRNSQILSIQPTFSFSILNSRKFDTCPPSIDKCHIAQHAESDRLTRPGNGASHSRRALQRHSAAPAADSTRTQQAIGPDIRQSSQRTSHHLAARRHPSRHYKALKRHPQGTHDRSRVSVRARPYPNAENQTDPCLRGFYVTSLPYGGVDRHRPRFPRTTTRARRDSNRSKSQFSDFKYSTYLFAFHS
jgi:hypothetical protein